MRHAPSVRLARSAAVGEIGAYKLFVHARETTVMLLPLPGGHFLNPRFNSTKMAADCIPSVIIIKGDLASVGGEICVRR